MGGFFYGDPRDNKNCKSVNNNMAKFNMAPESKIRFPFSWNHGKLENENYTLVVKWHVGKKELSIAEKFYIPNQK